MTRAEVMGAVKQLEAHTPWARDIRARLLKLERAIRTLGKCGSCGGSGKFKRKWIEREEPTARDVELGRKGRPVKDPVREELVTCRKCDGTGLDARARRVLA